MGTDDLSAPRGAPAGEEPRARRAPSEPSASPGEHGPGADHGHSSADRASGVDVLLADGSTALLRPLRHDDGPAIADLFSSLSRDSLVMRFFGPHRVTDDEITRLLHADGIDTAVLAVERAGRLLALAEYDRQPGSGEAEVAFVVADQYQGRGLGTLLLEHMADLARRAGISRFVVDTLAVNAKMLGVLRAAGFARQYSRDSSVTRVLLDISPTLEARDAADERDRLATRRSIERLLRPRSIAVIGASRQPGTVGHELLRNLVAGGFTGPVYPVNPEATSVASLPAWPSIDVVPGPIDVAVVAVPADKVIGVAEACGRAGVGGLVVISAGFAETGAPGATAQRALVRTAHHFGMRIIGPNCFGMVNVDPAVSMNATFATHVPRSGRIGFASQSGGLGIAILAEAAERGLGLSAFVSMGNKADVSSNDLLTWWEVDPGTDVVLLYIESFGNPPKFNRLARRFGRAKPIVAVKSGRSGAGSRAASWHTAAPMSPDQAVDALFEQTGVIRVDTVEELFDVGAVLAHQPVPRGRRVGIIGNAGGPGVLAADAVTGHGLEAPELSPALQEALHELLSPEAGVGNPVDMVATATATTYRQALELVVTSGEVDAVIVIFTPPLVTRADDVADAVVEAVDDAASHGHDVPVIAAFLGTADARIRLQRATRPVPCFTYPESAARALAHAVRYGRWRAQPPSHLPELDGIDPNGARQLIDRAWEDAPRGAVELTLHGQRALELLAFYSIASTAATPAPHTSPHDHRDTSGGDLVATAVTMARDPSFGPLVTFTADSRSPTFSAGSAVRVAPLTVADARHLVFGQPLSPLLTGHDGQRAVDTDGLVDLLLRISRLGEDLAEVTSISLDPLLVGETGLVLVDVVASVTGDPVPLLVDRPRQLR